MTEHTNLRNCCEKRFPLTLHVVAVMLVLTCLQTATGLSVEVTRIPDQSDEFTFLDDSGRASCSEGSRKSCKDYRAMSVLEPCDSPGQCRCRTCRCGSNNPTFLPSVMYCAGGKNITSVLLKTNFTGCEFYVAETSGSPQCPTEPTLVTLNTSAQGVRQFSICAKSHRNKAVSKCEVQRQGSRVLKHGSWRNFSRGATFASKKLQLQWTPLEQEFEAQLILLPVSCVVYSQAVGQHAMVTLRVTVKSCLLFKSSGRSDWWISSDPSTILSPSTIILSTSTFTTTGLQQETITTPATGGVMERNNFERATVAVFIAVILATVLLGILVYVTIFSIRRCMKRDNKGITRVGNPTYRRGADETMMGPCTLPPHQNILGHMYQPLVENSKITRIGPVGSRTLAHFRSPDEDGVLPTPIPRCFSECTYQEAKARNRPKDVVCTDNPIYQEVLPCNGSMAEHLGLHPPPLPQRSQPRQGHESNQLTDCKAGTSQGNSGPPNYLELLSDDGMDSSGYLHPVEHQSSQRKVPDPSEHEDQSNGEKGHSNKRQPSFNQNQTLPKLPATQQDTVDVQVAENNKNASGDTSLSIDPDDSLLSLEFEDEVNDCLEFTPPVAVCVPVVSVAVEVENNTFDRPKPTEVEAHVSTYCVLDDLATLV